jgi:hypothetical protein
VLVLGRVGGALMSFEVDFDLAVVGGRRIDLLGVPVRLVELMTL